MTQPQLPTSRVSATSAGWDTAEVLLKWSHVGESLSVHVLLYLAFTSLHFSSQASTTAAFPSIYHSLPQSFQNLFPYVF